MLDLDETLVHSKPWVGEPVGQGLLERTADFSLRFEAPGEASQGAEVYYRPYALVLLGTLAQLPINVGASKSD